MLYLGVSLMGGLTDQAQHSLKYGYIMQLAGCVVWPVSANNPDSCPSRSRRGERPRRKRTGQRPRDEGRGHSSFDLNLSSNVPGIWKKVFRAEHF